MDAGVCGFQRACGAACPDGGYKEKCRRGESLPSGGASISGEVKEPPDLKDLRPKGQKVNSGLKLIRGKQESRSQKKASAFLLFLAGSFVRRTDKIFEKISKAIEKVCFYHDFSYTVYNKRFKRRTFRFSKYPGRRKRTKRGHRFLVRLFRSPGNFTESVCPKAQCVCALPFRIFCCPFRTRGTEGSIINDGIWGLSC